MTPKTIIALKLNAAQITALDVARNAQEIKPDRAQAALHFLCKGLGITDTEETKPEAAKTTKKK